MKSLPIDRLALGTVQFGMGYGFAAGHQQVSAEAVKEILIAAKQAGITLLDTAASYGESEAILGATLVSQSFDVISKTLPIRQSCLTNAHLDQIKTAFDKSLTNLGRTNLEGLLVHDAQDLFARGGCDLWRWMEGLRCAGTISRIGVSVYDSATALKLAERFDLDIIQIPFNVFDQRIVQNGFLDFCRTRSIAVHARSIYLQGVILMQADDLPSHLSGLRTNLQRLEKMGQLTGCSVTDLALAYVAQWPEVKKIVVGVHDADQLAQLVSALHRLEIIEGLRNKSIEWDIFHCDDYQLIDPRMWM